MSQVKPILPLLFVVNGDQFQPLQFSCGAFKWCSSAFQPQWGTVEVCAGGTAVGPGGVFCSLSPLLHRCLLAYMSCHMFPAQPPPKGAKSVFAHNLYSLTRLSLTLRRTHGVYVAQQKYYSAVFCFFFFSFLLPLNPWITFPRSSPFIYMFQVWGQDENRYQCV